MNMDVSPRAAWVGLVDGRTVPKPQAWPDGSSSHTTVDTSWEAAMPVSHSVRIPDEVRRIEFDATTDRLVLKVMERNSQQVIRQLPSEAQMRQILRARNIVGLILDEGV